MAGENKIETPLSAVEAAFDDVITETNETTDGTNEPVETSKPVETAETEPAEPTGTESTPTDGTGDDETLTAPMQVKGEFANNHWKDTPVEAKKEIIRLAEENEKNFRRASEAEYNAKKRREVLKPVMGYVKQTAEIAHISEDEVVRNSLDIIQALNDNPTQATCQMIAGKLVKFEDPVMVIDTIAKAYGLDIKHDYKPNNVPSDYYKLKQAQQYEKRQSQYVKEEPEDTRDEERLTATTEFLEQNQDFKARMESDADFSEAFIATVRQMTTKEPYLPYADILNRAARQFMRQEPTPAPTTIIEKKAKVVAPKRTNPIENKPITPKAWNVRNASQESGRAARDSVLSAMRDLGLDE